MAKQIKHKISYILLAVVVAITAIYFFTAYLFPIKYDKEIVSASVDFELDENLIRAVIWTESKYDENAVSPAGAVGLMQIMPSTRIWIETQSAIMSDGSAKSEIYLGCWYLKYLINEMDTIEHALMAYNAGQGAVRKWLDSGEKPYKETADYVFRVRTARRIYSLII